MVVLAFERKKPAHPICTECKHFMPAPARKWWDFLPDDHITRRLREPKCAKGEIVSSIDGAKYYYDAREMRNGVMWSFAKPECGWEGKVFEPKEPK